MQSKTWLLCFVILATLAIVAPVHAQVLYGSMVGVVTDPTGAAVPNAAITVTNNDTGLTVTDKTDEAGRFSVPNLAPGRYDLKVVASGFRAYTRTGMIVSANTAVRAD